ncbi:MAG TPA: GNAT family N-acetyltransferase, partial [Novosphingobium sp.]|nr:GNAT family N-acetyltransferase [Novosphingobium sp.]
PKLMAAADLAIGAGGAATWERCALGLPTLAICLADNQRELLERASRAGLLYAVDSQAPDADELAGHIKALLASSGLRHHLSRNAAALVDGRGAHRVAAAMAAEAIVLRPAEAGDCQSLHGWRNHPAVRGVSRDAGEIALSDHQAWFSSVLQDETRDLLIGEVGGRPVGVVRFDRLGTDAEVSIYLVPQRMGQGAGPGLLLAAENWLKSSRRQVKMIKAVVLEGNAASLRLFERCGYARQSIHFSKRVSS